MYLPIGKDEASPKPRFLAPTKWGEEPKSCKVGANTRPYSAAS